MEYQSLIQTFRRRYEQEPRVFRAPGRINLIGEHTDYNEGFVFPAGVDKEIVCLIAPSSTGTSSVMAYDLEEEAEFDINQPGQLPDGWGQYVAGVIRVLQERDYKPGQVQLLISGNIPRGAGMSSSAAFECALLEAMDRMFEFDIPRKDKALLAQRAENVYVGVNCGIMDQFASLFAREDHALLLDCRDLSFRYFPLKLSGYRLLLVNTLVHHSLADSEYNVRRRECEEGLQILRRHYSGLTSLRDAGIDQLEAYREEFPSRVYMRCKYVIEEIARTLETAERLKKGDLEGVGKLMYATHDGLQHAYEVSCAELDVLVDVTRDMPFVAGARMMGGGFGGCTLNLVSEEHIADFRHQISEAYKLRFGRAPEIYEVTTADGAAEVSLTV